MLKILAYLSLLINLILFFSIVVKQVIKSNNPDIILTEFMQEVEEDSLTYGAIPHKIRPYAPVLYPMYKNVIQHGEDFEAKIFITGGCQHNAYIKSPSVNGKRISLLFPGHVAHFSETASYLGEKRLNISAGFTRSITRTHIYPHQTLYYEVGLREGDDILVFTDPLKQGKRK